MVAYFTNLVGPMASPSFGEHPEPDWLGHSLKVTPKPVSLYTCNLKIPHSDRES
ncbi:hypothetical protein IQ241_03920 [Romeria aff. gracilis LEGE 07310]|uniref:Uncharacterized protein n=1 Tax=Vasconcelosia minhoensis LEGE 07310 TaxID=915328 RepID=A0A8J7AKP0_9CYAN|nr:hypothetical protein [Romeria gracilis]MBE9076449.1 hypothetical protein [Romeria aff. gracilis LEGE 07310]